MSHNLNRIAELSTKLSIAFLVYSKKVDARLNVLQLDMSAVMRPFASIKSKKESEEKINLSLFHFFQLLNPDKRSIKRNYPFPIILYIIFFNSSVQNSWNVIWNEEWIYLYIYCRNNLKRYEIFDENFTMKYVRCNSLAGYYKHTRKAKEKKLEIKEEKKMEAKKGGSCMAEGTSSVLLSDDPVGVRYFVWRCPTPR